MAIVVVQQHEKLVAYQKALASVRLVEPIARSLGYENRHLRDQLRRAVVSIPLNLAEGAGEFRPAEKARFYRMALRSCTESLAILDVIRELALKTPAPEEARSMLGDVIALTTALIHATEDRLTTL